MGSVIQLLAVFGAYAAGSASLLVAISLSAALAKGALTRAVRRGAAISNRATGALLAASGIYLVLYWLPSLGSGSSGLSSSWAARSTRRISADLASFFAAHTTGLTACGAIRASVCRARICSRLDEDGSRTSPPTSGHWRNEDA